MSQTWYLLSLDSLLKGASTIRIILHFWVTLVPNDALLVIFIDSLSLWLNKKNVLRLVLSTGVDYNHRYER